MTDNIDNRAALTKGTVISGNSQDNQYVIDTILARGGFSLVYKAHKENDSRISYIIKECFPKMATRSKDGIIDTYSSNQELFKQLMKLIKMFTNENEVYRKLMLNDDGIQSGYFSSQELIYAVPNHSSYCKPTDGAKNAYIIMPFISGKTLETIIEEAEEHPDILNDSKCCEYIIKILYVLQHCHKRNYLHLDIAPDNIYVQDTTEGDIRVALIDFGSAMKIEEKDGKTIIPRNGNIGVFTSKENFSAPELGDLRGKEPDGQELGYSADLYSVAAIFYYMLTGEKFEGDNIEYDANIQHNIFNTITAKFLRQGLNKMPEKRFQHASEMREAIEAIKIAFEENTNGQSNFSRNQLGLYREIDTELRKLDIYGTDNGRIKTQNFISYIAAILETYRWDFNALQQGLEIKNACPLTLQTFIAIYNAVGSPNNATSYLDRSHFQLLTDGVIQYVNNDNLQSLLSYFSIAMEEGKVYVRLNEKGKSNITAFNTKRISEVLDILKAAYNLDETLHIENPGEQQSQNKIEINITISKYLNYICMNNGNFLRDDHNKRIVYDLIKHLAETNNLDSDYLCLLVEKKDKKYLFPCNDEGSTEKRKKFIEKIFEKFEMYDAFITAFSKKAVTWIKENLGKQSDRCLSEIIGNGSLDVNVWKEVWNVCRSKNTDVWNKFNNPIQRVINSENSQQKRRLAKLLLGVGNSFLKRMCTLFKNHDDNSFNNYLDKWCNNQTSQNNANQNNSIEEIKEKYNEIKLKPEEWKKRQEYYKKILGFKSVNKSTLKFLKREGEAGNDRISPLVIIKIYEYYKYNQDVIKYFNSALSCAYSRIVKNDRISFRNVSLYAVETLIGCNENSVKNEDCIYWCNAFLKNPDGILDERMDSVQVFANFIGIIGKDKFIEIINDPNNKKITSGFISVLNNNKKNGRYTSPLYDLISYCISKEIFDKLSDEIKIALFHYAKNNNVERLDIEYTDENSIGGTNDQKTIKDANTLKEKAKELAVTYAQDEKFWENYEKDLPMKAALCTYYDEDVLKDYSYIIDFMRSKILPNLTETEYITNTLNYKSVNIFVYHIIKTLSFCPDLTAYCAVKYATRLFTGFHNHDKMIDWIKEKKVDSIERDLNDMQLKAILPHPSIREYAKFVCTRIYDVMWDYLMELEADREIIQQIMNGKFNFIKNINDGMEFPAWFGNIYKYNNDTASAISSEKYGYHGVAFEDIVPVEIEYDSKTSNSYKRKEEYLANTLDNNIIKNNFENGQQKEVNEFEYELPNYILALQYDVNGKLKIISGEQLYVAWKTYRDSPTYMDRRRTITTETKKSLKIKAFVFPAEYTKPDEIQKIEEEIRENNMEIKKALTEMSKLRKEILNTYNKRKGIVGVRHLWRIFDNLSTNSNISFGNSEITKENVEKIENICQNPYNYGNIETYNHYCEICTQILEIVKTSLELKDDTKYNAIITRFGEKQDENGTLRTYYAYFNIDGILGEYKIHINNARNLSDGKIYFDALFKIGDRIRIKYNGFDKKGYTNWTILQKEDDGLPNQVSMYLNQ